MYNCLKISILALLFLSCREDNEPRESCLMIFSDAQPVQFWLSECDTYNQHVHDGVFHRCFCQPWNCDDEIKIQFTDIPDGSPDTGDDFLLSIRDESGNELHSLPFTKTPPLSLAELAEGTNYSVGGDNWTIDVAPDVVTSGASNIFRLALLSARPNTDYEFHYKITTSGGFINVGDILIGLYDADMNLLESITLAHNSGEDFEADVTFNGGDQTPAFIGVTETVDIGTLTIIIEEFDLLTTGGQQLTYNLAFIPSELSPEICNEKVNFVIINETTATEVAKSDCQDIAQSHSNTILINYYNRNNFAGLVYVDDEPKFNIRISAIFFHQRFPGEDEVMELSSSLVTANSSVRRQRLMDTDYFPYYFHEKVILVLQHQFVTIYNKQWVKQDAYEIADGNRMYPEKKAKCWISEKDFLQRNVL